MLYFTSDNHFGNLETFNFDRRPFKNVKQCDKYMIKQINKIAKAEDTIYFIGDFFDCDGPEFTDWKTIAAKYVKKIKAKKILIIGNNEERIIKYFFKNSFKDFKLWCIDLGFANVLKHATITFNNKKYYLIHEPSKHKNDIENLFGHVHNLAGIYKSFGINVSSGIHYFKPLSEHDVEDMVVDKNKYINNVDLKIW